jgi:hypothetical protein
MWRNIIDQALFQFAFLVARLFSDKLIFGIYYDVEEPFYIDMVISEGAVMLVSDILDRAIPGSSFVRNASLTLSNLCRGRPPPDSAECKEPFLLWPRYSQRTMWKISLTM